MHIFLTGEKHIGKSTLIARVLKGMACTAGGILSVSSIANGVRSVYLKSLDGSYGPVLCGVCENCHVTRRCPEAFDAVGTSLLLKAAKEAHVVVIDEIGNIERDAFKYSQCVEDLLSRPFPVVFGVLQDMADSYLAEKIRTSANVRMYRVDASNRDSLVNEIAKELGYLNGMPRRFCNKGENGLNDLTDKKGTQLTLEDTVTKDKTAQSMKSGEVNVLSTPYMIAFMEYTATECVRPFLEPGYVTVGTMVNIEHLAATPVGMIVKCTAKLKEVEGRKLTFEVEAWDQKEKIGQGTHQRFVVNAARFEQKTAGKLQQLQGMQMS